MRIEPAEVSELSEGDTVRLRCSVESNPPSQVEWRREGTKEVVAQGAELNIPALSRTHADTYVCQAKNSLGLSSPKKIALGVKCKFFISVVIHEGGLLLTLFHN